MALKKVKQERKLNAVFETKDGKSQEQRGERRARESLAVEAATILQGKILEIHNHYKVREGNGFEAANVTISVEAYVVGTKTRSISEKEIYLVFPGSNTR